MIVVAKVRIFIERQKQLDDNVIIVDDCVSFPLPFMGMTLKYFPYSIVRMKRKP